MNAALFHENPDPKSYVSLVPTSAITGEGMGNLLALLVTNCQSMLSKRLMYSDELQVSAHQQHYDNLTLEEIIINSLRFFCFFVIRIFLCTQATVLEVKAITGLGTTIDCILVNGKLREGDTIVLATSDGSAVVTQIRSLLMPQPMKELRVKVKKFPCQIVKNTCKNLPIIILTCNQFLMITVFKT
jgi:translation initiation factor 5B